MAATFCNLHGGLFGGGQPHDNRQRHRSRAHPVADSGARKGAGAVKMTDTLKILALVVLVPVLALAALVWGVIRFFLMVATGLLTMGVVLSLLTWAVTGGHAARHLFLMCALPLTVVAIVVIAAAIGRVLISARAPALPRPVFIPTAPHRAVRCVSGAVTNLQRRQVFRSLRRLKRPKLFSFEGNP
jgi:hypothetical protein